LPPPLSNSTPGNQGISKRCLTYFDDLNNRIGKRAFGADQTVTGAVHAKVEEQIKQAKSIDEQKGFSRIANDVCLLCSSGDLLILTRDYSQYYEKAVASPLGQRVVSFYTETSKQVLDIHEEARRIAQEERRKAGGSEESAPAPAPIATEKEAKSPVA
jgi:hypothetical protein